MTDKFRKITAIAAATALCAMTAGCGEDTMYIGSAGGTDIPAGVYIYFLQNAYYEATSKMTENDTDVFSTVIEEKNARDWMLSSAREQLADYAAVESKFDEYGLTLTEEETSAAKLAVESMWEYYGEAMENFGIAESSYRKIYTNNLKKDKLFEKVYGADGDQAVSDEEIKSYMTDSYALINYIEIELKDGSGNLLKSDGKEERMKMAEDYVARAKNGEDFDSLNAEYTEFYNNLKAEAEAAAAETATETEETSDGGMINFEAIPSDAEEMAPIETSGEVTAADTGENSSDTDISTDGSDAPLTDTLPAETSAPVTEAPSDETTSAVSFVDFAQIPGGETTEETGTEEAPAAETPSNKQVIAKESEVPDKAVTEKVFGEMQTGDIEIIESTDSESYFVVYKMDLLEDEEYFSTAKESLLYEMKSEDFDRIVDGWTAEVAVTYNEKAVSRYTPDEIAKKSSEE